MKSHISNVLKRAEESPSVQTVLGPSPIKREVKGNSFNILG